MNKYKLIFNQLSLLSTLFIMSFLFTSVLWIRKTFGNINIEQIVFHLFSPIEGAGKEIVKDFNKNVILLSFIFTAIIFIINDQLWKYKIILGIRLKNYILEITVLPLKLKRIFYFLFIIFLVTILLTNIYFNSFTFIIKQFNSTNIYKENYIDPQNILFKFPEKKRNLILIFLESIETSYFSIKEGGYFQKNLIPELYEIANKNINFSHTSSVGGYYQVYGTGWTVAALVAHTSGVPLNIPIGGNEYGNHKRFLPGLITLMDILNKNNYYQVFMIGSDKKFAGRDKYFEQHGNVFIKDLNYFKNIGKLPENYHVWWGFEDRKLYQFAKEELSELSKKQNPFALYMLTVDTHHIGGYLCELCKNEYPEQYKNVLNCASKQAADFIYWLEKQSFFKDTTIVILGDHLYMDSSFFPGIKEKERKTLNIYINSQKQPIKSKNRAFSALDSFPTIMDAMGIEYNADGLGLGRSLFRDTRTILEIMGYDNMNEELSKPSKEYWKFIKVQE